MKERNERGFSSFFSELWRAVFIAQSPLSIIIKSIYISSYSSAREKEEKVQLWNDVMTNNGSFFSLSLSLRIHFAEIDLAPRNMTAAAGVSSQQSAVSSQQLV
jgi:hypothetical protein